MPCEAYKQALIHAVAMGETPSGKMAAHLNGCSACRVAFVEEQQLFAAINSGLRGISNNVMPASLVPRVRSRLEEQSVNSFGWLKVGVLFATAALVVVTAVFIHRLRRENREPPSMLIAAKRDHAATEIPTYVVPAVEPQKQDAGLVRAKRSRERPIRGDAAHAEVAVLVPAGQKQVVDALLAALRSGTMESDGLVAAKNGQPPPTGELSPLGIPEIQIKPLAAVSEEPPTK
jgi:anti-sigma factor RsiW